MFPKNQQTAESSDSTLPEHLKNVLAKANITSAFAVFTTPLLTLQKHGLGRDDYSKIRKHYAGRSFPGFSAASDIPTRYPGKSQKITFGCTALDRLTQNGITTVGVTEIAGEAGSGKSQMCMQLALMVQMPRSMGGLEKGAVFICTEDAFASQRLFQMAEAVRILYGARTRDIPFANRIFVDHVTDVASLLKCVTVSLPKLLSEQQIGLVVIDSVGAIFRTETSNSFLRALDMRRLVASLLALSNKFSPCAVICVNQVTSVINSANDSGDRLLVPCLGLAWASLVSNRFQLHRTTKSVAHSSGNAKSGSPADETILREMEVVFSPHLAPSKAEFVITADGLTDVPEQ